MQPHRTRRRLALQATAFHRVNRPEYAWYLIESVKTNILGFVILSISLIHILMDSFTCTHQND